MKSLLKMGMAAGLMAVVSGCAPEYYVPNAHNVPVLQRRGDATLSGHLNSFGVELQGAYAIGEHIGVMLNGAGGRQTSDEDSVELGEGKFVEAGFGYYRNLSSRIVWETYALLGVGRIANDLRLDPSVSPPPERRIEATFVRYGIQPSLTLHSRHFDASASVRLAGLRYSNVSGNLFFGGTDQVAYLDSLGTQFLIEPAFTVRAGWDPVKVVFQLGRSSNQTTPDFRQIEGIAALGVVYSHRRRQ